MNFTFFSSSEIILEFALVLPSFLFFIFFKRRTRYNEIIE